MTHRALAWPDRAVIWLMLLGAVRRPRGQTEGRDRKARSASLSARQDAPAPATPPGTMKFRVTRRAGLGPDPDQPAGNSVVAGSNQVFALDPAGADWTLSLNAKAEVEISYQGVVVIKGSNVFLAGEGKPAAPNITVPSRGRNQAVISGAVDGFGLKVKGRAVPLSAHELRIELDINAQKPMTGLFGGGMAWSVELDSPVFREKVGEPKLLLDRTGWRWPVRPGQDVMVRFDAPLATLAFVKDEKKDIRTFFIGQSIRPGHGQFNLTVTLPETGRIMAPSEERYANPNASWFRAALPWDAAPVDLTFLNAADRPAGRHGCVKVAGDRLVFEDGTPARFWGANLSGPRPVFHASRQYSGPGQADRPARLQPRQDRPARLGLGESQHLRHQLHGHPASRSELARRPGLWIKCLEDQGVYVWLDMHWRRQLKPRDGITEG